LLFEEYNARQRQEDAVEKERQEGHEEEEKDDKREKKRAKRGIRVGSIKRR